MKTLIIALTLLILASLCSGYCEAETIEVHYIIQTVQSPTISPKPALYPAHAKTLGVSKEAGTSARAETVVALTSLPKNETVFEKIKKATHEKFGEVHIMAMESIVFHESGFNPFAVNKISGACGLFQALPCSKMNCELVDVDCQINWGLTYVSRRYNSPNEAWNYWQLHHWY